MLELLRPNKWGGGAYSNQQMQEATKPSSGKIQEEVVQESGVSGLSNRADIPTVLW